MYTDFKVDVSICGGVNHVNDVNDNDAYGVLFDAPLLPGQAG
eukprot:SAG31_NODE_32396_length_356_cov_1.007782_1_plen_41_part_10